MFRNFVDPPSLDRESLNEWQKRNGHAISPGTEGVNSIANGTTAQAPQHESQNGIYTTSIYVGGSVGTQPQYHPQNIQYYQDNQQLNGYNNNVNQQYGHLSTHPGEGGGGEGGYVHVSPGQYQALTQQLPPGTDLQQLYDRLSAVSFDDLKGVNGTQHPSASVQQHCGQYNNHNNINGGVDRAHGYMPQHNSFPNASYPNTLPHHVQHHYQHTPTHGHALDSIQENGLYGNTQNGQQQQHQQQQLHHQHNYPGHQQQTFQHQHHHSQQHQQHHGGQLQLQTQAIPETMPQQSWGSGWSPPKNSSTSPASGINTAPLRKRFNVVPPPPPLIEPVFVGRRDVKRPGLVRESEIVSEKGTVRGFKNRVRAGIATFWAQPEDPIMEYKTPIQPIVVRNFRQLEQGKIVVYATSMSVVRETGDRCKTVRNLLQNHMVRYEERDLYMSREIQAELLYRLKQEGIDQIRLPHVFADGVHMGGSEELEKLNEAEELRGLLDNYQKITVRIMCDRCGGYRYVPCDICHGSKRSLIRNHFLAEFCSLRCMHCNDSGLKRCDQCRDQQE